MERYESDVAILGAGPSGTAAAAHLGALGVRRVVIVDRHDFPRDKTCASGISPKGIEALKELGVWDRVEACSYPITGLRLVTRGDRESWLSGGAAVMAVVCNRRVLDQVLLERALSHGITFLPRFDASETIDEGGRTVGLRARDGRELRAKLVMIAGGSHCRVGQSEQRPRRTIQAIMGWWQGVDFRPHHVEMIFDRSLEPYYGWLFPEDERLVNIGITYEEREGHKRNARELFSRFLEKHYGERLRGATQLGRFRGHPVVWSYRIERLTGPGVLSIGEAGLMTHPATAEGIYQGVRSGMLGAEAVSDVLGGRVPERDAMREYEGRCRSTFQLSFWGAGVFRRMMRTDALDRLLSITDQPLVRSATARLMARM